MSVVRRRSSREDGRLLLIVLFVVYLLLLAWIVLWKFEFPWVGGGALRQIKLVPLAPSAETGASTPREVIANIMFFVPFGIYLALLAPTWRWWKRAAVIAGASFVLEVGQYVLAVGSSDVTDLIVNTAGGLAGIGLLTLARRRLQARTAAVMTRVCSIGTVLALLATGIFVASPLHYAQRDVSIGSVHSAPVHGAPDVVARGWHSGQSKAPNDEGPGLGEFP